MKKCPYCELPVDSDSVKCGSCFRSFNIIESCFDDFESNNKWCIRFFRLIKNAPIPPRKPVPYESFSILDVTDWDEYHWEDKESGAIVIDDAADGYNYEVSEWEWEMYEYLQEYFPHSSLLSKYKTGDGEIFEDDEKEDDRSNFTENSFNKSLNNQIENLFPHFQKLKKIFWVGDEHRRHPWSIMPGGCTVVVVHTNGDAFGYDKVKRPQRYMKVIIGSKILGKFTRDDNIHISTLQEYIKGICITEEGKVTLKKVWSNDMNVDPWKLLEPYATR